MKLGFTGTRHGMTTAQLQAFTAYVRRERPTRFHHGGCLGADAQAHRIVRVVLGLACPIEVWPSNIDGWRADIPGGAGVLIHEPQDPLLRNHQIVNLVDKLFVTPESAKEIYRSGTWTTYRYAKRVGRRIVLCNPAGEVNEVCDV